MAEAKKTHERARVIREQLTRDDSSTKSFQSDLAFTYENLGEVHRAMGQLSIQGPFLLRAISLHEAAPGGRGSVGHCISARPARAYNNLGNLRAIAGKTGKALESYERAVAIQKRPATQQPSITGFRSSLAGYDHMPACSNES